MAFAVFTTGFAYAEPGSVDVDIDGTPVTINYDAQGVEVVSVDADLDFVSLIIDVDVSGSPGILEITLERSYFDSVFDGTDEDFIIIADGEEPTFEEIETTSTSRTLQIELENGTDELEIIGTDIGIQSEPEPAPEPEPEPAPEPEPEPAPEPEPEPAPEPKTEPTPTTSQPKTQCGPGTVLKDGACVLDQSCGPGTILQDGVCVLDESESTSSPGMGKELIIGVVAAFIVALIVGFVLWMISRGSRQK